MAAIMIVDDSAFMRLILKDMIQKSGHRLAGEAENGWTAVQTYREVDPDLVIMNIIMPDLNGIEALKKNKEHPSFCKSRDVLRHGKSILCHRIHSGGSDRFYYETV